MQHSPRLYLAPMEGLGDRPFRVAITTIGGFDEACTSFLRVPSNAHCPSLAKAYIPDETAPIPQAVQVMGGDSELVAQMCVELQKRGAPRIDLNCGCPSNRVTGRAAGSSLLKEPERLHSIVKAMVDAVTVPVSVKVRSGFDSTALFDDNVLAAQEAGAVFVTVHPRTKVEGYGPPARWELIARAKELLRIPVVGNGDILTGADARRMLDETQCDGLMVGRGAVMNPWIFHEIREELGGKASPRAWEATERYLRTYGQLIGECPPKVQCNKIKQMLRYLFSAQPDVRSALLRERPDCPLDFLNKVIRTYKIICH
jgi:tRNA-dihydrouridine synthase C